MIANQLPKVFAAVLAVAAVAVSQTASGAAPDPNIQREFGAKLQVCGVCHGNNGVPKGPTIPIIWGQQENYIAKQLHDFRSGDRTAEVMKWMSDTLDGPELAPGTTFFSTKSWPARARPAAAMTPPTGIAVCAACHQQNFMGAAQAEGKATPRLAGQNYEYLIEQMRRFAAGERKNDADMVQIMKAVSPADREAMARYLSAL
jgi:cytochrome c553